MTNLVDMLPQHRLDPVALARYLARHLDGSWEALAIRQFQGGQSNPTYLLEAGATRYVLRKQPPGPLLPKAHQIDREFRIMRALDGSGVPVPRMLHLADDTSILGTEFFVMEHIDGQIALDMEMVGIDTTMRAGFAGELMATLARLHGLDWRQLGLADFGRPEDYAARQVERWGRQYDASRTAELPAMDRLRAWLTAHIPSDQRASIAHGDYRIGNVMLAKDQPRILAVLDWELSTIGHPLADFAYSLLPFHLPHGGIGGPGLQGLDLARAGIPGEQQLIDVYCRAAGIAPPVDLGFFLALGFFRLAAIVQGVYARSLQGNASSLSARQMGPRVAALAEAGLIVALGGAAGRP